jgi:hypothetical protein
VHDTEFVTKPLRLSGGCGVVDLSVKFAFFAALSRYVARLSGSVPIIAIASSTFAWVSPRARNDVSTSSALRDC